MVLDARSTAIAEEFINCRCFGLNKMANKHAAFLTNKNAELALAFTLPCFHITSEATVGCFVCLHSVAQQQRNVLARMTFMWLSSLI